MHERRVGMLFDPVNASIKKSQSMHFKMMVIELIHARGVDGMTPARADPKTQELKRKNSTSLGNTILISIILSKGTIFDYWQPFQQLQIG